MSFKTNLLITLAAVVLFAWMGFPVFHVCHGNGGNILSCGLVAFRAGGMKTALIVYFWFWALLIDGLAHLIGKS